jgi:hypothetical protein
VTTAEYVPGSCNIGKREIRRRQIVALIGLFFSTSALITLLTTNAPRGARFAIFFPLLVASIGWVQSRRKFCLAYGFMGTFNFGKLGDLARVADKADRRADQITALTILAQSAFYAIALTLVVVALPL